MPLPLFARRDMIASRTGPLWQVHSLVMSDARTAVRTVTGGIDAPAKGVQK